MNTIATSSSLLAISHLPDCVRPRKRRATSQLPYLRLLSAVTGRPLDEVVSNAKTASSPDSSNAESPAPD